MAQHPQTANAADFFESRGAMRRSGRQPRRPAFVGPLRPVRYASVPCTSAHDVFSPSIFSRCMSCHGTGFVQRRVS